MKRIARNHLLVLLIVSLAMTSMAVDDGTSQNRLRTNPDIDLYLETDLMVPQYVSGKLSSAVSPGSELTAAVSFFEQHQSAYRMKDPARELVMKTVARDQIGMTHVRLDQYHDGIKVYGGELLAHFNPSGELRTVNGFYVADIDLAVKAAINATEAKQTALADLESFFGAGDPEEPELIVFPWEGTNFLAWRTVLWSNTPMGRWEYFVDAKTGEVIFKANRIMSDTHANDIGTGFGVLGTPRNHIDTDFDGAQYRMLDYTRRADNNPHGHDGEMPAGAWIQANYAGPTLPGTLATDADNVWDDPNFQTPAVDAHVYTALVYDWMLREFGRNSFDDQGSTMLASVNYYAEGTENAYWNGNQMVIWAWSTGYRSLAGCPDVIAHEWGHAITDYCSDLIYQKESGALNEAFSDMIGTAFEHAHDTMDTPDWFIAENWQAGSQGFRNVQNPHQFFDPDYYGPTDPYWQDVENCIPTMANDLCGVHSNCGVGSKWFYLLSAGGTHHGVTVTGIGIENAIRVAYRANCYYWVAATDYADGAWGTILAANDLDPTGVWGDQAHLGWTAVGVTIPPPALEFAHPTELPRLYEYGTAPTLRLSATGDYGGTPVIGSGLLHYAIDGGSYTELAMTDISPGEYEIVLPDVDCGSYIEYYFSVDETTSGRFYFPDPSSPYKALPYTDIVSVMENDLSTSPGWTTEGQWAFGQPTGNGGSAGGPDPTSGYTGPNVYGYNLSGDYPNNLPERHLTSSAIDCSGMVNTHLRFWRWLGVETSIFDHAYVRVSNNGVNWTTVWENPEEITDYSWVDMEIDISDVADNQSTVYLRWTMGTSDGAWISCGWNIDDIEVVSYDCSLWMCGDFNDDGAVTLSDITRMIDYVYISKTPIDPMESANVNGSLDLKVTLSDITMMIDHVYISKEPLGCL